MGFDPQKKGLESVEILVNVLVLIKILQPNFLRGLDWLPAVTVHNPTQIPLHCTPCEESDISYLVFDHHYTPQPRFLVPRMSKLKTSEIIREEISQI